MGSNPIVQYLIFSEKTERKRWKQISHHFIAPFWAYLYFLTIFGVQIFFASPKKPLGNTFAVLLLVWVLGTLLEKFIMAIGSEVEAHRELAGGLVFSCFQLFQLFSTLFKLASILTKFPNFQVFLLKFFQLFSIFFKYFRLLSNVSTHFKFFQIFVWMV